MSGVQVLCKEYFSHLRLSGEISIRIRKEMELNGAFYTWKLAQGKREYFTFPATKEYFLYLIYEAFLDVDFLFL